MLKLINGDLRWNSSFLLVRIKSMHVGFEDWKQVRDFIKLSRLNKVLKSARCLFSTEELKSPIKMTFSYFEMYLFKTELRFSRKPFSFCPGGL